MAFGLDDFLFGSLSALGGSKHGIPQRFPEAHVSKITTRESVQNGTVGKVKALRGVGPGSKMNCGMVVPAVESIRGGLSVLSIKEKDRGD
jgi:hypothetical protein